MDWALWYLKVRLWKFDGTVSEKMPRITVEALIEQLRGELKALGISHREAEQLAGICRRKLDDGAEQRFLIFDLLRILEGVGIEPADFFARAFRKGELSLVAFGKEKPAQWPRRRRPILNALAKVEERGSRGFLEIRGELRRIEHLRDEDPAAAEKAAWNLLKTEKAPGALVGALAILISEASREQAHQLLILAFELLGPDLQNAAAGKLLTAMGRNLYLQGQYEPAIEVLERHALPIVAYHGDQEDLAFNAFLLGLSKLQVGDRTNGLIGFEKAMAVGSERLKFAVLQALAAAELNQGLLDRAWQMYDEVMTLPYFAKASQRARLAVRVSRQTARMLAQKPVDEREFRAAVEEARDVFDSVSQVRAAIDLATYLKTAGKFADAVRYLKAEIWNLLDLEDSEVRDKFFELWQALGQPEADLHLPSRIVSPMEPKLRQPHPLPILQKKAQSPTGREASPKG